MQTPGSDGNVTFTDDRGIQSLGLGAILLFHFSPYHSD